jgi:Integrase zinc binding domain
VKYNFRIAYRKGTENAKADALSKRSDFIGKEDKQEILLKEGKDRLEYSSKVAVVYKVIKDLATKQQIRNVYKGDAKAKIAKAQKHNKNGGKPCFAFNDTGLIRFRRVVYLLEKIKKEFVKEIHKEPLVEHLGIDKTKEAVAACYYFLSISRMTKQVVKECNTCNKSQAATHKPYRLLMLLLTLKEL